MVNLDSRTKEEIICHAAQSMELNPDRGAITAIKDAADFHEVDFLRENEIEALAFELLFERKDMDF